MITAFYAGILALGLVFFSFETIKARRKFRVSVGTGPNDEIAQIVGAHSNFTGYVPMLLLLLYFAERAPGTPTWAVQALGLAIVLGRLFHYLAFRGKMHFKLRVLGMQLTLWSLIVLGSINIFNYARLLLTPN